MEKLKNYPKVMMFLYLFCLGFTGFCIDKFRMLYKEGSYLAIVALFGIILFFGLHIIFGYLANYSEKKDK